jgi:CRISPR-associated protein Cmr2
MTNETIKRRFHFTIGPVQGFVAQARRTRDFWAGSFLLSWLSGVAMREVMMQHGGNANVICFPRPDPAFIAAIGGNGTDAPQQGTIPNRFMAEVGDDFDPARVPEAVRIAWSKLADLIWEQDGLDSIAAPDTKTIWRRQVEGFWEMNWAYADSAAGTDVLDRRKNLRSHLPPAEPGIKCMLMDGWQELSGASCPGDPTLERFWTDLREGRRTGFETDFRAGEHLCALAYIKRRFVRWFKDFSANAGDSGWTVHGWPLPASLPSVSYMAAVHWLESAIDRAGKAQAAKDRLWAFHDAARDLLKGRYPEAATSIRCVERALAQHGLRGGWKWTSLDGDVFLEHALRNHREFPDPDHPDRLDHRAELTLRALNSLRTVADLPHPSPFYSLLLMDGDNLGAHMSQPENQEAITEALAKFTGQAKGLVETHNGYLIFAGGDDVLALLPLEDALPAAAALHRLYGDCFAGTGISSTLSGAIEYAHVKMPLTRVIRDAHDLLDHVAKDGRGRDAIACRVWKPGGQALEWAMPWEKALSEKDKDKDKDKVVLQELADAFRVRDQQTPFANRFFYRIRERLDTFAPRGQEAEGLDEQQTIALMAAEYLGSGVNQARRDAPKLTLDHARETVRELMGQCREWSRSNNLLTATDHWPADGALLLRFLAKKGVE